MNQSLDTISENFPELTKRESEILDQILKISLHDEKKIAQNFGISSRTVGVHTKNIRRKMGASSIIELFQKVNKKIKIREKLDESFNLELLNEFQILILHSKINNNLKDQQDLCLEFGIPLWHFKLLQQQDHLDNQKIGNICANKILSLTHKEWKYISTLVSTEDNSNITIASELKITQQTLDVHKKNVFKKLGLHKKVDLYYRGSKFFNSFNLRLQEVQNELSTDQLVHEKLKEIAGLYEEE